MDGLMGGLIVWMNGFIIELLMGGLIEDEFMNGLKYRWMDL